MEKVKDAVRARITEIADTEEDDGLDSYIQKKLDSFLPPLGTAPSHPPYASMIQKAIEELNEEGGSSEVSISKFIREQFDGLPPHHESFLSHHLKKLCQNGEILLTDNERYVFVDKCDDGVKRKWRKGRRKRKFRGAKARVEKQNCSDKQDGGGEQQGCEDKQDGVGDQQVCEDEKDGAGDQQVCEDRQDGAGDQQVCEDRQDGAGEQPVCEDRQDGPGEQPVCEDRQDGAGEQPICEDMQDSAEEQPVCEDRQNGAGEQPISEDSAEEQPICEDMQDGAEEQRICEDMQDDAKEPGICEDKHDGAEEQWMCEDKQDNLEDQRICEDKHDGVEEQQACCQEDKQDDLEDQRICEEKRDGVEEQQACCQDDVEEQAMEVEASEQIKADEEMLENGHGVEESKQDIEATDIEAADQQIENNEEGNHLCLQEVEEMEESSDLQGPQSEAGEGHALACKQKYEMIFEQNKPRKIKIKLVRGKVKEEQDIVPHVPQSSSKCLDHNGFLFHQEEHFERLVRNKTETMKPEAMKHSYAAKKMRFQECTYTELIKKRGNGFLDVDQQEQLTKSSLTEIESDIDNVEGQLILRDQENGLLPPENMEVAANGMELCYFNEDRRKKNFWTPINVAYPSVREDEFAWSLRKQLLEQQKDIIWGQRSFSIICGLPAQRLSESNIPRVCNPTSKFIYTPRSLGQFRKPPILNLDTDRSMDALLPYHQQDGGNQYQTSQNQFRASMWSSAEYQHQWRTCNSNFQTLSISRQEPDRKKFLPLPSNEQHRQENHSPVEAKYMWKVDSPPLLSDEQDDHCQIDAQHFWKIDSPPVLTNDQPEDGSKVEEQYLWKVESSQIAQQCTDKCDLSMDLDQGEGRLQEAEDDQDAPFVYFRQTYIRRKSKV